MTTTLEEELKAMEEQLAAQGEEGEAKPEEVAEEAKPAEEVKAAEEEPKEPEKPAEEAKPAEDDAKGAARLRIEAKKERERADKLAEENRLLREAKVKEAPEDEREEAIHNEIAEVLQERKRANATKEFLSFEEEVRAENPEYDVIAQKYANAQMAAVRLENPRLSGVALQEATMNRIVDRAAICASKGYDNPVKALFEEAVSLGFTAEVAKKAEEVEVKEKAKPDMAKVADNRKKSPGMAATGGGDANGQLTKKYAVENFTLADFAKLSQADAEKLMYGG